MQFPIIKQCCRVILGTLFELKYSFDWSAISTGIKPGLNAEKHRLRALSFSGAFQSWVSAFQLLILENCNNFDFNRLFPLIELDLHVEFTLHLLASIYLISNTKYKKVVLK